jgi:hypothetical protein
MAQADVEPERLAVQFAAADGYPFRPADSLTKPAIFQYPMATVGPGVRQELASCTPGAWSTGPPGARRQTLPGSKEDP